MTTQQMVSFLIWSAGINYSILLLWFALFIVAHDWMYRLHNRWFRFPVETFDMLNYAGMAFLKLGLLLLNLVPLAALLLST